MKKTTIFILLTLLNLPLFSQKPESTKATVSGSAGVTSNGISLVPAFSLKKPAAIFDVYVKKNKFSFEPEMTFSMEDAKPWYFVFWLRYKLIESSKFNLGLAFHPGFLFATEHFLTGGVNREYVTTSRFFVGAISPSYSFTEWFSAGLYYQYARGYNSDLKQGHFFGINCNFSDIKLGSSYFVKILPQVYYLNNDHLEGFYACSTFTLAKRDFPLSISALMNQKLKSDIPSDDFLWNVTLTCSF
ncbi:MAG: hypothetical protein U0T33_00010 [Bacteroidales bacterium]